MYDLLHALAKWLEATGWATVIRTTRIYPFIQLIHFSGLTVWLGSNTIVDLRILGLGQKRQTAAQLAEALLPWNWIGFSIVVLGGFLLFSGIGTTYLVNAAFRVKLGILCSLSPHLAHRGTEESAHLGPRARNTADRQAQRFDRNTTVALCRHCGRGDPELLDDVELAVTLGSQLFLQTSQERVV